MREKKGSSRPEETTGHQRVALSVVGGCADELTTMEAEEMPMNRSQKLARALHVPNGTGEHKTMKRVDEAHDVEAKGDAESP